MQIRTIKKSELLKLLESYPPETQIEITVTSHDLEESKKEGTFHHSSDGDLYAFGIPGDCSYDPDKKVVAFQVWSKTL